MTKQEELDKLEMDLFMLEMKDTWFTSDFKEVRRLKAEINRLESEINGDKRNDTQEIN